MRLFKLLLSVLPNHLQVQQKLNSKVDFEDVNVDLKLSFLKLIYGTGWGKLPKKNKSFLFKNAKLNRFNKQNNF